MTLWITRGSGDAGWENGLPPAITPEMWPRDHGNGLPLVHAFTVRVPEPYRTRGPTKVALSYFHPGESESYGPPAALGARIEAVLAKGPLTAAEQAQPFFVALAAHVSSTPRDQQTFIDLLGHTHAIIWHTEAELAAPRCPRPEDVLPPGLAPETMHLDAPVQPDALLAFATTEPPSRMIQFGLPLHWIQAEVEDFGELVLEIADGVGGANYGSGNCQIDLEHGLLDWACD